ncbi:hypothetical protein niasHT_038312 [Heterodera trifolii]|uniref:Uncharacterized protein n=1 Tax=Heterodera trifolii TaxID=157864 RepID=A0ABD2HNK4_9BILA
MNKIASASPLGWRCVPVSVEEKEGQQRMAYSMANPSNPSGRHINPAVSLMFLSFKQLAPLRFVLYSLVQLAGAFLVPPLPIWSIGMR